MHEKAKFICFIYMQPQKVKFKSVQINMKQVSYCCFGCCCFVLFPGGGGGDCFFGLFLVFTVTPGVMYEKYMIERKGTKQPPY